MLVSFLLDQRSSYRVKIPWTMQETAQLSRSWVTAVLGYETVRLYYHPRVCRVLCRYRYFGTSNSTLFSQFGGQVHKDVNHTEVMCTALEDIECAGPREFLRGNVPCIK